MDVRELIETDLSVPNKDTNLVQQFIKKELRREYIESFVKKQLANIIFNEDNIPSLVAKFREYNMQSNEAANEKCKRIEK